MIEFKEDSSDVQDQLALYFGENSNEFKQLGKDLIELCTSEGISKGTMVRVITQMIKDDLIDSIPDPNNKSKRNYIWSHQEEGIDYEPE